MTDETQWVIAGIFVMNLITLTFVVFLSVSHLMFRGYTEEKLRLMSEKIIDMWMRGR